MLNWLRNLIRRKPRRPPIRCWACESLITSPPRTVWLTVYRFECDECGASSHFDFETYPVVAAVRSHDTKAPTP